jgi:hypothetical protein
LIINLQITDDNFPVAWQLVSQQYHYLPFTLDAETHKELEIHTTAHQDIPLTTEVITFLGTCKALELLQNSQAPKTTAASPQFPQSAGAKVSNTSHFNLET